MYMWEVMKDKEYACVCAQISECEHKFKCRTITFKCSNLGQDQQPNNAATGANLQNVLDWQREHQYDRVGLENVNI